MRNQFKTGLLVSASAVALTSTAQAGVVVVNQSVGFNVAFVPTKVDFDGNGVDDFQIDGSAPLVPLPGGIGTARYKTFARGLNGTIISPGAPLSAGAVIDASAGLNSNAQQLVNFTSSTTFQEVCTGSGTKFDPIRCNTVPVTTSTSTGLWLNSSTPNSVTGYMGFRFAGVPVSGVGLAPLFGWMSITVNQFGTGTINSWGYQNFPLIGVKAGSTEDLTFSIPLPPIPPIPDPPPPPPDPDPPPQQPPNPPPQNGVPLPPSLALLALGVVGLAARRRKSKGMVAA